METKIFIAQTKESALACVQHLCEDVKSREDANHKLFFARRMFNFFQITNRETRSVLIIGANVFESESNAQHLKGLHVVDEVKNCMSLVGESEDKAKKRKEIIDWLLDKEEK